MIAKAAWFRHLVADTLPDNAAMKAVFRTVGLAHRSWLEQGVVRVQLDLTADNLLQDDAYHRDWQAAVRSLQSLVDPTHVVVIGAGRSEASPGRRILTHLLESFTGRVSDVYTRREGALDFAVSTSEVRRDGLLIVRLACTIVVPTA